jgi:hypothetical protein
MTRQAAAALVASLVIAAAPTAVAGGRDPSVAEIRRIVEASSPSCRLDVDEELTLGRTKLWFVRRLVAMVDDVDPEARAILAGLRRVEVGSYRVHGDGTDCSIPVDLEAALAGSGWNRTVRWQEGSDLGFVFQRLDDDDRVDGMLVLEIDSGSVEIVRLEGRVHDILMAAVRDDPGETASLLGVE